jgi:hypothetical protein
MQKIKPRIAQPCPCRYTDQAFSVSSLSQPYFIQFFFSSDNTAMASTDIIVAFISLFIYLFIHSFRQLFIIINQIHFNIIFTRHTVFQMFYIDVSEPTLKKW